MQFIQKNDLQYKVAFIQKNSPQYRMLIGIRSEKKKKKVSEKQERGEEGFREEK